MWARAVVFRSCSRRTPRRQTHRLRTSGDAASCFAWPPPACWRRASQPGVGEGRLSRSYDSSGITRVILRAAAADTAKAEPIPRGWPDHRFTGRATGGAEGYHPADPKWRETPAAEWGLDFVASRFGATLVISSKNEIGYIHHHYVIADIVLQLPPSVELVRQARTCRAAASRTSRRRSPLTPGGGWLPVRQGDLDRATRLPRRRCLAEGDEEALHEQPAGAAQHRRARQGDRSGDHASRSSM